MDKNAVKIYLKSIFVSVALIWGVFYFQIVVILALPEFKAFYLVAPGIVGILIGVITGRVILLNHKLKWFSVRDSLTQAFNHGYYKQILNDWSREKTTFSLILIDIDDFKKVNDKYGHQAGDKTLVRLCEIITDTKRLYDVFARHGGEEFVLLTPRTDLSEAADLAKRLCELISETPMPTGSRVTCSFGVAQFRAGSDTPDSLFERADKALYESKKKGKNCVTLESPSR